MPEEWRQKMVVAANLAAKKFSTNTAFSEHMGVSRQAICGWVKGYRSIGVANIERLCAILGNEITPHDLRPDVFSK